MPYGGRAVECGLEDILSNPVTTTISNGKSSNFWLIENMHLSTRYDKTLYADSSSKNEQLLSWQLLYNPIYMYEEGSWMLKFI